jgi:hypothetical protein
MGILANVSNLNPGQFKTADPLERTRPLSRYGTEHPVDKALWLKDELTRVKGKITAGKSKPHEVLAGVAAAQGRGK